MDRGPFLAESLRTSHDQLLHHVRHRDNWLRTYLIAEGLLLTLTLGMPVGPVAGARLAGDALTLSAPMAILFLALYAAEDRLVVATSGHLRRLSAVEAQVAGSDVEIPNLESRLEGYAYSFGLRVAGQLVAFWILPALLSGLHFYRLGSWTDVHRVEAWVSGVALLLLIPILSATAWFHHHQTLREAPPDGSPAAS